MITCWKLVQIFTQIYFILIGPKLPMDRYCKVFRFLFKIFFPYQLYPGLERGSLLLLLFLFLIPVTSSAEGF